MARYIFSEHFYTASEKNSMTTYESREAHVILNNDTYLTKKCTELWVSDCCYLTLDC